MHSHSLIITHIYNCHFQCYHIPTTIFTLKRQALKYRFHPEGLLNAVSEADLLSYIVVFLISTSQQHCIQFIIVCDLAVNVVSLVSILRYPCWKAPLFSASRLSAFPWAGVFNRKIIRSQSAKSFHLIWLDFLITSTSNIKIKVVLIIFVIQYIIYFTFEYFVFGFITIGVWRAWLRQRQKK